MSSQAAVFDLMRQTLRIDKLSKELSNEIYNLNDLSMLYQANRERQAKIDEK